MGMGILRLSPSAFWSMTFGEVSLALDANRESEEMLRTYGVGAHAVARFYDHATPP